MKPFLFIYSHKSPGPLQSGGLESQFFTHCFVRNGRLSGFSNSGDTKLPVQADERTAEKLASINCPFFIQSENDAVIIGTDALSLTTLYFVSTPDFTVISNSAAHALDVSGLKPVLSDTAIAGWLAGQPVPQLSIYSGLQILPAGHYLRCSKDNVTSHKYWDIDPENRIRLTSDDEYATAFRELFTSVVEEYTGTTEVAGCQMSGGMDSTSVTSLVHQYQKQHKRRCIAVSHYYKHDPKSDETELIRDMREYLQLEEFHFQDVDKSRYRNFLSLYPPHFDHPGIVLSPRYRDELSDLKQMGISKLFTGNGGDEICWGHASAYTQRLREGEWGVLTEVYKACVETGMSFKSVARELFIKPFVPTAMLNMAKRLKGKTPGVLPLPAWLTDKSRLLANEAFGFHNPFDPVKEPASHARYFALKTTTTFNSVRSYDAIAAEFDIEVKHPFFDYRLAEFSFAVPPSQLIRGPYPKFVLRNAMSRHLPDSVCWRQTKTTFDHHFGNLVRENAGELRECLSHPYLSDRGLIDNKKVLKAFDDAVYNRHGGVHVDLLFVILTQRWIQAFHV